MRSLVALWAAAILIAGAAACSGGGGSHGPSTGGGGISVPAGSAPNTSAPQSSTKVTIRIPSASSSNSKLRRAKYVSSATLGATVSVYAALATPPPSPSVVVDLSSNSTTCTTNSDGSRSCSISISAPVGSDNFVFNTYDQAPVNGTIPSNANLLSASTIAYTVALSSTTPTLSITLNGVAHSLAISPTTLVIPSTGTSTFAITVDALDADGNFIIGPGSYVDANGNAVTISLQLSGDTNNEVTLSANSVTTPGTTVSATYNGAGVAETPTITASASGFTSVSLSTQITSTAQTIALSTASTASPTPTPTATATPTPVPSTSATATATPAPTATAAPTVPVHLAWNFNHTTIASGRTIWFTGFATASGVSTASNVTVNMANASITFTSNGTTYTVAVPNFALTFSPSATDSTVTYSANTGWAETVPSTFTGSALIGAVAFPVTTSLASAINPVTWTATFTTTQQSGLSLQWAWRAGVYTTFDSTTYNVGAKPVDVSTVLYPNTDKPGTPETYKADVVKGATGNGGSDYIGSSGESKATTITPSYAP